MSKEWKQRPILPASVREEALNRIDEYQLKRREEFHAVKGHVLALEALILDIWNTTRDPAVEKLMQDAIPDIGER